MKSDNPNIEILETTVECLGCLAEHLVFLGGFAAGILNMATEKKYHYANWF